MSQREPDDEDAAMSESEPSALRKPSVLVVEDDPVIRAIVEGVLKNAGYPPCCAAVSGEEALDLLEGSWAPNIVLMDIELAGMLDGIETARRMIAKYELPVIFMTSSAHKEVGGRFQSVVPYGFVQKPIGSAQLVATIETAIARHSADTYVRANSEWLSTVLSTIGNGIVAVDNEGLVTYANPAAASLLGTDHLTRDVVEVITFVDEKDRLSVKNFLRGLGDSEQARGMESVVAIDCPQLGRRILRISIFPIRGSETAAAVLLLRDVSKHHAARQELKSFKMAVESMQIGVTMSDLDRRIRYVNPAESRMHGYEPEELIGQPSRVLGGVGDENSEELDFGSLSRWTRESTNIRKNGETFPVLLLSDVVCGEDGIPNAIVTCCEDLTERYAKDREIHLLNRAMDQSPDLIVITNMEGEIEYVNSQFEKTTGYSAEEAIGQNPRILKAGGADSSVYEELWETITSGETWVGEFCNRKKDGSNYWCIATISGVHDENGVVSRFIGVQKDITERKRMERLVEKKNEELERLNRLKSDMMAITSHDLKSPLNAIISLAGLLQAEGPTMSIDQRKGVLADIVSSGMKLTRFIGEVLDAEKIESKGLELEREDLHIQDVLDGCVDICRAEARTKMITVSSVTNIIDDEVNGDPMRLEQVFNNLLSNAVKFSPRDSEILVELSGDPENCLVSISDQGPGIPDEDLEKVFSRYFQAGKGHKVPERGFGIGLGLFISSQLVELHGGTVWAENREGGGLTMRVRLPLAGAVDESSAESRQLKALVLDGDGSLGSWLGDLLARKDVVTMVVDDIHESLDLVRGFKPNIIFGRRLLENPSEIESLSALMGKNQRVVSIEQGEHDFSSGLVHYTLMAPVADAEIFELIDEIEYEVSKGLRL